MAKIVAIPKDMTNKDLVLIPRKEYESLKSLSRKMSDLDKSLERALEEVRQGKVIGPFDNANDLMKALESSSKK